MLSMTSLGAEERPYPELRFRHVSLLEGNEGQLGDFFCFEGDCAWGENAVKQMMSMFKGLQAQGADVSRYAPAYQTILESYNEQEDALSRHVPFTQVCCRIKEIGVQAQDLTSQLSIASGTPGPRKIAPPVSPTDAVGKEVGGVISVLKYVAIGLGVVVVGGAGFWAYNRIKGGSTGGTPRGARPHWGYEE